MQQKGLIQRCMQDQGQLNAELKALLRDLDQEDAELEDEDNADTEPSTSSAEPSSYQSAPAVQPSQGSSRPQPARSVRQQAPAAQQRDDDWWRDLLQPQEAAAQPQAGTSPPGEDKAAAQGDAQPELGSARSAQMSQPAETAAAVGQQRSAIQLRPASSQAFPQQQQQQQQRRRRQHVTAERSLDQVMAAGSALLAELAPAAGPQPSATPDQRPATQPESFNGQEAPGQQHASAAEPAPGQAAAAAASAEAVHVPGETLARLHCTDQLQLAR